MSEDRSFGSLTLGFMIRHYYWLMQKPYEVAMLSQSYIRDMEGLRFGFYELGFRL